MASFQYSAQNSKNAIINGMIQAASRDAALATLKNQGLKPLSLNESKISKGFGFKKGGGKVKTKDLVIFTRQLSTMVSAGVPLLRALTTLGQQAENPALKKALEDVSKDVQSGMALGDALGKHPNAFDDVYVNMVKAGEAGGILDDILKRLAIQQEKNDSMRKKIKGAMTYPTVLIVITVGAFFGLMFFVVPTIGQILKDLAGPDAELPKLTQVMLAISGGMKKYWYLLIGGGVGGFILIKKYLKTPVGRSQFHHLILKAPAVGNIVTKIAVARFARTFASMVGAGVSVLEALRVTANAVGNEAFKEVIMGAAQDVKNGEPLSKSIEKSPLFPGIVPQMLAVGEETGQTDVVLIKIADFYDEEVDTLIDSVSSIIEPIMIVIMGGMVGLVAASVMGPISSLSQNISG
ncbi:secretion system protein [Candidatus Saccharibacteria bacterium]|nr:MAG: secretion system protein [Candidatus Saccharibacteria bacterium]